ncbi:MAG: hypothetical protein JRE45_18555 [Deltaproteobacteria bacterium]|nr:hypothetical protein [Deltaproteobacteria bacterium]
MTKRRFTPWIALACIGALAACASGEGGTAGNTELNVIVPTNAGTPNEIDITTVEYTIACAGGHVTFLDNNASFANEVRIDGNLEVVDGRTDPQGAIPPEFGTPRPGDGAEVWQGFMDLPPGPCAIELRARDNDGEVICTAIEPFVITADTTAKVNLVLICDTSFQAPVGTLDVDATFSFNVGNFCPDLFILNCLDSNPYEEQVFPPPNPPLAGTQCEVRYRDGDSTCGQGCDPQTCVPTATGLSCTPGPEPGVSTTVTCTNAVLDCNGDGAPDPSCTWNGDVIGVPGQGPSGPFEVISGPPPPGTFFAYCLPEVLGGTGASIHCTAVTTDGDLDCDKTKVVTIQCPSIEGPCFVPDDCDDGNDCTADFCDDSSGSAVCVNTPVLDGTPCNAGAGSCQTGMCATARALSLGCANSTPLGEQSVSSAVLNVAAGSVLAGQEFDARLSGSAIFPELFLDAAQQLVLGGVRQATLLDLQYLVQVRSGATLVGGSGAVPGVSLGADVAAITPGEVQDSDCAGLICNPPVILIDLPTSDDCAPGGVCDTLGKATGPSSQCVVNGFCVTGDLDIPLAEATVTYAADPSGDVLFGWADQGLGNSTFNPGTNLFTIPKPNAFDPIEQGLKMNVGLTIGFECVMGIDAGQDPTDPDNTLIGLTPDTDLISFPIGTTP